MRSFILAVALMVAPVGSVAETSDVLIADIVSGHILPRFEALSDSTKALSEVANTVCDPASERLRMVYGDAFDAWVSASHLRFGPSETEDRAFALAFWPDSRGATPRALSSLLAAQDAIANSVKDYAQVSIAARGFYALEFLLYDEALMAAGEPSYHCQLVRTISADIALTSERILRDWQTRYGATMQNPSPDSVYRTQDEVLRELFKSLSTGLQFTSETRLGRPLGTYDRPRPNRAEARRSGRSSQHVVLSLRSLQDLATRLADDKLSDRLSTLFDQSLARLAVLDDPTFAGTFEPQTRLRVEIIQQSIDAIRAVVRDDLGPTLGVAAGFNALDGD